MKKQDFISPIRGGGGPYNWGFTGTIRELTGLSREKIAFTLAEVLATSDTRGKTCLHGFSRVSEVRGLPKQKFAHSAFTLAEVLITLAIIGVVAALTIPSVVRNYQKQQYVTGLKKMVITLEQGFKLCMANDGVSKVQDCSIFTSIPNGYKSLYYAAGANADLSAFQGELNRYFKVVKFVPLMTRKIKSLSNNKFQQFSYSLAYLADGSSLSFSLYDTSNPISHDEYHLWGGKAKSVVGDFYIDVNGDKTPNQFGRDVFRLRLTDLGSIIPNGGREYAIISNGANWETYQYYWKSSTATDASCDTKSTHTDYTGWGCAARIMEEGWQMNY